MATPVDNKQIEKRGPPEEVKQDSLLLKMLPAPVVLQILTHAITSPKDILTLKGVCRLWNEILWFSFMPIMSKVFGLPRRNPFPQPSTNTKMALAENLHNHAKDIAEIMSSDRPEEVSPFINNFNLSIATRSEKLHYLKQAFLKNNADLVKFFSKGLNLSHLEKLECLKQAIIVDKKDLIKFFSDDLTLSDAEKNELIPAAIQSGNMDLISGINLESLTRADKMDYLNDALMYGHTEVIDFFFSTCPIDFAEYEIDTFILSSIEAGYLPFIEKHYVNLDYHSKVLCLEEAQSNDHNEKVIEFIFKNCPDLTDCQTQNIIARAICRGSMGVLEQFDFDQFNRKKIFYFLKEAIRTENENIINFFFNKCPNLSEDEQNKLFEDSVKNNKVVSTNFLLNHVISDPIKACKNALKSLLTDNFKMRQFLIDKILANKPIISDTDLAKLMLLFTARFGLLDQMKVILETLSDNLLNEQYFRGLSPRLLDLSIIYGQPEVMNYILTRFSDIFTPEYIGQKLLSFAERSRMDPTFWELKSSEGVKHLLNAVPEIPLDYVKSALRLSIDLLRYAVAVLAAREDILEDHHFIEELTNKTHSHFRYYRPSFRPFNVKAIQEAVDRKLNEDADRRLSEANEDADRRLSEAMATIFESESK